jgi:hypothetical protein
MLFGIILIAAGLFLAYKAGADASDRAAWQEQAHAQYVEALAPSRSRHPGGQDAS